MREDFECVSTENYCTVVLMFEGDSVCASSTLEENPLAAAETSFPKR